MNESQFNAIKAMVLSMLRFGEYQQALGTLQGACAVTNLQSTKANSLHRDLDRLFKWVNMAGECAIDRRSMICSVKSGMTHSLVLRSRYDE